MNSVALAFWLTEFLTEALAAFWLFRSSSKIKTLGRYLAFRCVADVAAFSLLLIFGGNVYGVSDWLQRAIQYVLLAYVAAEICSQFAGEKDRQAISKYSAVFAFVLAGGLTFVFGSSETITDKLLDTTIAANMLLAVAIAIAWLPAEHKLPRKWRGITTGLLIYLGSEAVLTILWKSWPPAAHLFPLGHIAAFVTWCAVFKPKAKVEFGTRQQQITRLEKMYGT